MTTDAEIRSWAKESGHDVPARGKVPDALRTAYTELHPPADNPGLSGESAGGEHGYAEPEPMPTRPQTAGEVAPTPPPGKFPTFRRVRAVRERGTTHKRVSLESIAEGIWGVLGNLTASQGLVPTGRALHIQAPVAGMIIEDALRGTVADRVMQPIARNGEAAKEIGALLGVPILVTILTVKPQAAPQLVPQLKRMLREWAIVAGPRIKAREKREKKALEQLGIEDPGGLDALVDEWITAMFEPPPEQPGADVA